MTEQEARVLRDLRDYRAAHGVSPTLLDLARMAGRTSKSGIRPHMQRLIALGYVEAASGPRAGYLTSRGYRVSAAGLAALAGSGASPTPTCPECGQPIAGVDA